MAKPLRLIAGSINYVPDDEEWDTWILDASSRGVWDPRLDMGVQPHFVSSITAMPMFRAEMFNEIRLWHVLEHLTQYEGRAAIPELSRILKPNGVLDIEVPDIDRLCAAWVNNEYDRPGLLQWFFSEQLPSMQEGWYNDHRFGYTEDSLRELLNPHFIVSDREETGLAVRFRAVKR